MFILILFGPFGGSLPASLEPTGLNGMKQKYKLSSLSQLHETSQVHV